MRYLPEGALRGGAGLPGRQFALRWERGPTSARHGAPMAQGPIVQVVPSQAERVLNPEGPRQMQRRARVTPARTGRSMARPARRREGTREVLRGRGPGFLQQILDDNRARRTCLSQRYGHNRAWGKRHRTGP